MVNYRINQFNDQRNVRLNLLKDTDNDTYKAVIWYRQNKHKFQAEVAEPAILSLVAKNLSQAALIEAGLRFNDWLTFIFSNRQDYLIFMKELVDCNGGLAVRAMEFSHANKIFPPKLSEIAIREWGLDGYLLSAVEGPELLLNALCHMANFHRTVCF